LALKATHAIEQRHVEVLAAAAALACVIAAVIARLAYMPVSMSVMAMPTFIGPAAGQIVALAGDAHRVRPCPWNTKS